MLNFSKEQVAGVQDAATATLEREREVFEVDRGGQSQIFALALLAGAVVIGMRAFK